MTVNLKDVAKMAGVSEGTASLALNGSTVVKDETRDRVKRAAEVLGYSPNAYARRLAKSKSNMIGLIVPDIENVYYGKLVRYIDEAVRDAGYELILAISADKPKMEKQIVLNFISQRVEGIMIAPGNLGGADLSYMKNLKENNISCVFVTAHYPDVNEPYVMVDLEEGTYKLVNYLLDLGHRRIVFLAGMRNAIPTEYRIKGYIRAFSERGVPFSRENLIECQKVSYEEGYEIALKRLQSLEKIDAIIAINDGMALGVVNALRENGISVPSEISVAGYDNMIFSMISPIPITTVEQDVGRMAKEAVNMLGEMISGKPLQQENLMIKPELIIRESTGRKVKSADTAAKN